MGRTRIIPEINESELGVNPFENGLVITVTKKINKVLNKEGKEDVKEFELEATPYTKLFQVPDAKVQISDLPLRSQQLYLHIIHAAKSAKDYLWIDRVEYMRANKIKSDNTFKHAVRDLALGGYISKHIFIPDLIWINPYYFFKGSRINKFKDKVLVKPVKKKKS